MRQGYYQVRFWNSKNGQMQREHQKIKRGTPLRLSPDAKTLAVVKYSGKDGAATLLWDVEQGRHLATLEGHSGSIPVLAFSPDSRILASGSSDTTILLWDVARARSGKIK